MAIQLKQSLKLSQQLRMTPQLQQAIKLLQLSRVELEAAIRKELNENPVLEEFHDSIEDDPGTKEKLSSSSNETGEKSHMDQDPQKQDEFDWESYMENSRDLPSISSASQEFVNYENMMANSETLREHLNWQVQLYGLMEKEELAAYRIIDSIDDNGYLQTTLEHLSQESGLSMGDMEDALYVIQELDPPGVGARSLKECLLIQAKFYEEDTSDLVALIENHLPDLEQRNFEKIAQALETPHEIVAELYKLIMTFDPKPGRRFQSSETFYVTPDVYVYKAGDDFSVSLNEDGIPKLKISHYYKNLLNELNQKGEAKDFIQEKLKSALWLLKSLHQRQKTIFKVMESIVKFQPEFFEKGPSHLRPLILKDVALDIEMHESTVSRVTTNKYVHTPQGLFELKYFFNSSIGKTGGDVVASQSVKFKIKQIIAAEDNKMPLSDQKLVDILKNEGIKIARRTVAKYREQLGILPSNKRKKLF